MKKTADVGASNGLRLKPTADFFFYFNMLSNQMKVLILSTLGKTKMWRAKNI